MMEPFLLLDTPRAGRKGHRTFVCRFGVVDGIQIAAIVPVARKAFLSQGYFEGIRGYAWKQSGTQYHAFGKWVVQQGDSARESVEVLIAWGGKGIAEREDFFRHILETFPEEERLSAENREGIVLESSFLQYKVGEFRETPSFTRPQSSSRNSKVKKKANLIPLVIMSLSLIVLALVVSLVVSLNSQPKPNEAGAEGESEVPAVEARPVLSDHEKKEAFGWLHQGQGNDFASVEKFLLEFSEKLGELEKQLEIVERKGALDSIFTKLEHKKSQRSKDAINRFRDRMIHFKKKGYLIVSEAEDEGVGDMFFYYTKDDLVKLRQNVEKFEDNDHERKFTSRLSSIYKKLSDDEEELVHFKDDRKFNEKKNADEIELMEKYRDILKILKEYFGKTLNNEGSSGVMNTGSSSPVGGERI